MIWQVLSIIIELIPAYNNTLVIMHPKTEPYLKIVNIRQETNIGCRTTTPYVNMFLTIRGFALPPSSYSFDARLVMFYCSFTMNTLTSAELALNCTRMRLI